MYDNKKTKYKWKKALTDLKWNLQNSRDLNRFQISTRMIATTVWFLFVDKDYREKYLRLY